MSENIEGLHGIDPEAIDPENFDAAAAARAAGEGARLMQSFVRQDQDPSVKNDLAVVSDFLGTELFVPVLAPRVGDEAPQFAAFKAGNDTVLGVSLREQDAIHVHRTIAESEGRADDALGDPITIKLLGSELVALAFNNTTFAATGIDTISVDPLGLGIAFRRDDALLDYPLRSGALRRAVHQGKEAVLAQLLAEGATGVYMFQPDGEPQPMLLRRPSDGAQVFPLFSSSIEVFRFSDKFATAELTGEWLRGAMPAGMHLVVDPAGGDAIEFSPEELEAAGFRTQG